MRIVLAGSGRLSVGLFRALQDSRHEVVGVVQNGRNARKPFGRLLKGMTMQLAVMARASGIPVFWIDRMDEMELAPLRVLEADLLLVGGFGIIIKPSLLAVPRIGCVNVHSSLLPRHRGPNPFTAVVLAGETESGVTFHVMDPGIDTGDILDQTPFGLPPDATMLSVYHHACDIAEARVVAVMDGIASGGLVGTPQDESLASYDKKTEHAAARIDWARPAREIERMVRGLSLPEPAYFVFRGAEVPVYSVRYDAKGADAPPGTVVAVKPQVTVAAMPGTVALDVACTARLGMRWPAPWMRIAVGDVIE